GFFTRANALGKAKARKAFGLLENDFVIGRLSRRDMSKWEDMPIQAMSMLSEKIPNAKFLIANAPQEAIDKIKKSPQAGRFIFIFAIPEERLGAFYAALDVFAYSSRIGESFGYVIAEAMATARPVVVNSTPLWDNAQIELVDNNNTGFVANSAKAMADAILKLYSNPSIAGKMGERAQQKAQKQYDEKQQTLMLSKIYVDLLKTKGIELPKQARKFNSIELVPSKKELALFGKEYSERLFDYCGKPDYGYEIEAHAFDRLNNRQFHRYAKGILRYSKLRKV
ncbi:MAG: glycosyltransferase family 4 protein, partial [Candidatus Micrarchaeia archaeon]